MNIWKRVLILLGVAVAVMVVLAILARPSDTPAPDKTYYTGAFRNKGHPPRWFTADGREVPPPRGATKTVKPSAVPPSVIPDSSEPGGDASGKPLTPPKQGGQ